MSSFVQRIAQRLFARRAADMEQESREWTLVCPKCGHERSYWEIGGIRYKAWSRGKRTGLRCPSCGRFRMHKVVRRRAA